MDICLVAMEQVADGVWLVRGGFPKTMNVYLIETQAGAVMFDAGVSAMTRTLRKATDRLGGLDRIVLGHAHADHRGAAPDFDVPVYCHETEVADAVADGGLHYFDFSELSPHPARLYMPLMLKVWDGGPVDIAGTLREGDEVAGFEVIHLPGHAPGLIALWRESDRLALTSDTFYTLDPRTGRKSAPRLPHPTFNLDTEQAKASISKLAELEPAVALPGHADGLNGDVRAQLEAIAD